MTLLCGQIQRGVATAGPHVDIHSWVLQEHLHNLRVALAACPMQRRVPNLAVRGIYIQVKLRLTLLLQFLGIGL